MKQVVRQNRAEANKVDTTKYIYTVIFDMNNLMKISFVDKRYNDSGFDYGMVYRALSMMGKVLDKKDFNYCIACYDGEGSGVLRYEQYPEYKANRGKNYANVLGISDYDKLLNEYAKNVIRYSRKKRQEKTKEQMDDDLSFQEQSVLLKTILEELCVRQYEFENVEGDDIIAYYVKNRKPNEKIVIVSGDRDLTQLINEHVIIYSPRDDYFITSENSVEKLGYTHENTVLVKTFCGDASDNIKGIKGLGPKTMEKYFPRFVNEKMTIDEIVNEAKMISNERRTEKKKPLVVIENIINNVCDGSQGGDVLAINKTIIDLSEPLLTDEAREALDEMRYSVMDTTDRTIRNVYAIVSDKHLTDLVDERRFGEIFGHFNRIMTMEQKKFKENLAFNKN